MSKKKISWRLVIDTSVVAAASERRSLDSTPRKCREVLDEVLKICHRVVSTPRIRREWHDHRHRSAYAMTWLQSMYARKKVIHLDEDPEARGLADQVLATAAGERDRRALAKDLCLVEAALAHDGIVISRDRAMFELLAAAVEAVSRLREIRWADPVLDEGVKRWLRERRSARGRFRLGRDPRS